MKQKTSMSVIWVGLVAVALVAACFAFFYQPHDTTPAPQAASSQGAGADKTATATASMSSAAAASAPTPVMSVADLLKSAGTALGEARLIAPPGNNAAEYYLRALDVDANNDAARDGLRELLPVAVGVIEQKINAGQVDDGQRGIDLLARADPSNYTLTILRGKLELKKKQIAHDQDKLDQSKRDQDKQLAANATHDATTSAATSTTSPPVAASTAPAAAVKQAAASTATAVATPPAPAPASTVAAKPAQSAGGETRSAVLVNRVNPPYPTDAARKHLEGWVEVSFVVGADGKTKDVAVVNANPHRVFDAAATQAVASWTFQPRLQNGEPTEQKAVNRIEFRLSL